MIEYGVGASVRVSQFKALSHRLAELPVPFRPTYFSSGERVRNKDRSRIDDIERFSAFVDDHVNRGSGFDLVGQGVRFTIFMGDTRDAQHDTSHVGCSVSLLGKRWKPAQLEELLRFLCEVDGIERAYACRRDEWNYRHASIKRFATFSVEMGLGMDMSAHLPGLYWWTVFSDELVSRHGLDVEELAAFAVEYERWCKDDSAMHAFKLFSSPDQWREESERLSDFLQAHPNFFSMTRLEPQIDTAQTKEELDEVARPYRTGAVPWDAGRKLH